MLHLIRAGTRISLRFKVGSSISENLPQLSQVLKSFV